jgi:two-component system sensor histidine kinase/response regulator
VTHVLVVNDDEANREVMRWALEDAGCQVSEAAGGHEALAVLRASRDRYVVLLDVLMPNGDGVQFLEAVRADAELARRHRYLVLTALAPSHIALSEDLRRLLDAPVLLMPYDIDTLLAAVAQEAAGLDPPRP